MRVRATLIACLSMALLLFGEARAQESPPSEYQVKAAFLFNFAKFVEWPPESFSTATAPIVIGILGDNPFDGDLERTVQNKIVNNRPFVVRQLHSAMEATNCHILFISNSEKKRLSEIIQSLHGTDVLTVGETDRFIEMGGIINFVQESSKIRFQINDDAAKTARLKISSKLLNLAVRSSR